ncbi:hypothetical protein LCGC14_0195720 [marine sediment metagenome]|uniref:Uncharacterized protein n=1 Tax=marine sediment metagenome TaxID=412755 RepID=A0A0F9UQ15_9ZZZZ
MSEPKTKNELNDRDIRINITYMLFVFTKGLTVGMMIEKLDHFFGIVISRYSANKIHQKCKFMVQSNILRKEGKYLYFLSESTREEMERVGVLFVSK